MFYAQFSTFLLGGAFQVELSAAIPNVFFPPNPSKVYPMFCFLHRFYEAPTKTRHWIFGFIDSMFPKGNIPFIKPNCSPQNIKL